MLLPPRILIVAVALGGVVGCSSPPQSLQLADFESFPEDIAFEETEAGVILAAAGGRGYLATRERFGDAVVSLEYRWPLPSSGVAGSTVEVEPPSNPNTGLLLLIAEEDRVWPVCIEAQGKYEEMAELKSNGGLEAVTSKIDTPRRDRVRRPVGQWNQLVARIEEGRIRVQLNGVPVAESDTAGLTSGRIGLQSEGDEVEFRHVTVQRLGEVEASPGQTTE